MLRNEPVIVYHEAAHFSPDLSFSSISTQDLHSHTTPCEIKHKGQPSPQSTRKAYCDKYLKYLLMRATKPAQTHMYKFTEGRRLH